MDDVCVRISGCIYVCMCDVYTWRFQLGRAHRDGKLGTSVCMRIDARMIHGILIARARMRVEALIPSPS